MVRRMRTTMWTSTISRRTSDPLNLNRSQLVNSAPSVDHILILAQWGRVRRKWPNFPIPGQWSKHPLCMHHPNIPFEPLLRRRTFICTLATCLEAEQSISLVFTPCENCCLKENWKWQKCLMTQTLEDIHYLSNMLSMCTCPLWKLVPRVQVI